MTRAITRSGGYHSTNYAASVVLSERNDRYRLSWRLHSFYDLPMLAYSSTVVDLAPMVDKRKNLLVSPLTTLQPKP